MTPEEIRALVDSILTRAAGDPSLTWAGGTTMPADVIPEFVIETEDISVLPKDIAAQGNILISDGEKVTVPTLKFSERQLRKGVAGTEPTDIPTFTSGKAEIPFETVILPINIEYAALEDAVGKAMQEVGVIAQNAKLDAALGDMVMAQFANDLEDLVLNGDTADVSGDADFLNIFNGAIKLTKASGTKYEPGVAQTIQEFMRGLYDAAPARVRKGKGCCFYVASQEYGDLWDVYEARNTPLGDASLTVVQGVLHKRGIPVKEVTTLPAGTAFFGKMKAWFLGFKRQVTIERERKPRLQRIEYTLTARVGHTEVLDDIVIGVRAA